MTLPAGWSRFAAPTCHARSRTIENAGAQVRKCATALLSAVPRVALFNASASNLAVLLLTGYLQQIASSLIYRLPHFAGKLQQLQSSCFYPILTTTTFVSTADRLRRVHTHIKDDTVRYSYNQSTIQLQNAHIVDCCGTGCQPYPGREVLADTKVSQRNTVLLT